MSAGGLSYSGLTNYGKSTLPSVEAGLGSINILRDPPKSIHTRKIDKVGENSDITQMLQDSGDRACEVITQYARGVNPMVSVSYQNYGNNGGQRTGSIVPSATQRGQAFLPYAIGSGGNVFRPPTLRQENLLPLSRLPRTWTYAYTNKEFPDFSRKLKCAQPPEKTRQIKQDILKTNIRPTCTYSLEKPIEEPFEVKYVIQNPIQISGNSGVRSRDIGRQEITDINNSINIDPLHVHAQTQKGMIKHIDNTEKHTDKYIQESFHTNVAGTVYNKMQTTPINQIMDLDIQTKNPVNVRYETPQTRNKNQDYIHNDVELDRRLPRYESKTNNSLNIQKNPIDNPYQKEQERNIPLANAYTNTGSHQTPGENTNNTSRDYRLTPTINAGGFHNSGTIPSKERITFLQEIETPKNELARKAATNFDGRYRHGFSIGGHSQAMAR